MNNEQENKSQKETKTLEKKCGCCKKKRSVCKCTIRDLQMFLIMKQLGQ